MNEQPYKNCTLCPRSCHIDRTKQIGFCGMNDRIRIARAALHFWEEECISGKEGSGAVFFSGCNLRCVFCQNYEISAQGKGVEVSVERLADIFLELQDQKANNINLVTPTHFVPSIKEALLMAKEKGLAIPIVYNCSGYENVETLKYMEGLVDIYLPDDKYITKELAKNYSGASDYPDVVKNVIAEMFRQTGEAVFDERGMMSKGLIVRHLVLPGHTKEAEAILQSLFATYQNRIYYSIMSQYTPLPNVIEYAPKLNRRVTKREYEKVVNTAVTLGIENGYIQEGQVASESFIPAFDATGVRK